MIKFIINFMLFYLSPLLLAIFYGVYFLGGSHGIFAGVDFHEINSAALALLLSGGGLYSFFYWVFQEINPTKLQVRRACYKFLSLQLLCFALSFFMAVNYEFMRMTIVFYVGPALILLIYALFFVLNYGVFDKSNNKPLAVRVCGSGDKKFTVLFLWWLPFISIITETKWFIEKAIVYLWFVALVVVLIHLARQSVKSHRKEYESYIAQQEQHAKDQ